MTMDFSSIMDKAKNVATDYKKFLGIIIALVVLIAICVYVFKTYVSPKLNPMFAPNKEFVPEGYKEEAEVIFFYTTWCPHCKKAMPVWNEVKEEYNGKVINDYPVTFREVDCDKEEEVANRYNVEGYPTIKLLKGNDVIEYDAKPEKSTIIEFLHKSL
jgi:thiol-disulfide isomerase/thioredoxin